MVNVLFTQSAYEQLLVHMLQFGNKNLKKERGSNGITLRGSIWGYN